MEDYDSYVIIVGCVITAAAVLGWLFGEKPKPQPELYETSDCW